VGKIAKLCCAGISSCFKIAPRSFIFSIFRHFLEAKMQKFTAPFKNQKFTARFYKKSKNVSREYDRLNGLKIVPFPRRLEWIVQARLAVGFTLHINILLRKKNGSTTTRTRLNHTAHTAQSARLNYTTDGSSTGCCCCYILVPGIDSHQKRNHMDTNHSWIVS